MNRKKFIQNTSLLLTGLMAGAGKTFASSEAPQTVLLVFSGGVRKKDVQEALSGKTAFPFSLTGISCEQESPSHLSSWNTLFANDCFSAGDFHTLRNGQGYACENTTGVNSRYLKIEILPGFDCAHYNLEEYQEKIRAGLERFSAWASHKNVQHVMACAECGRNESAGQYDNGAGEFLDHHTSEAAETFFLFHSKQPAAFAEAQQIRTTTEAAALSVKLSRAHQAFLL